MSEAQLERFLEAAAEREKHAPILIDMEYFHALIVTNARRYLDTPFATVKEAIRTRLLRMNEIVPFELRFKDVDGFASRWAEDICNMTASEWEAAARRAGHEHLIRLQDKEHHHVET